jgi:hypothetical protein
VAQPEDVGELLASLDTSSQPWISAIVQLLMESEKLIVLGGQELLSVAEAIWRFIPAPLRRGLSFSVGIPFSISRPHSLVITSGNAREITSRVVGMPYQVIDAQAGQTDPAELATSGWAGAVHAQIFRGDTSQIVSNLADRFRIEDIEAADRIGQLCQVLLSIPDKDIPHIIPYVVPHLRLFVSSSLEAELVDQAVELVRHQLCTILPTADQPVLEEIWQDVLSSEPEMPDAARLVGGVGAIILARMSRIQPVRALLMVLEAAEMSCFIEAQDYLDRARRAVLCNVSNWLKSTASHDLAFVQTLLQEWYDRFPDDDMAGWSLLLLSEESEDENGPLAAGLEEQTIQP